jgi:hypothetical protein
MKQYKKNIKINIDTKSKTKEIYSTNYQKAQNYAIQLKALSHPK